MRGGHPDGLGLRPTGVCHAGRYTRRRRPGAADAPSGTRVRARVDPAEHRRDGRKRRCEPCCQSPTAPASPPSPATSRRWTSRSWPPTAPASTSRAEGVEVGSVSELTAVPALVGGQVKTFHPAVYAGILARRDVPEQLAELEAQGIGLIDLVVVNVKPFAPEVGAEPGRHRRGHRDDRRRRRGPARRGGPQCGRRDRRAAPVHYTVVVDEIRDRGMVSAELRARLAAEAFSTVAAYHAEIAAYLNQIAGNSFPSRLAIVLEKVDDLRYGENPHQRAAFYRETTHRSGDPRRRDPAAGRRGRRSTTCSTSTPRTASPATTPRPTVAIVKHTDPVGLASHDELVEAYRHALETDPVASFGGIVGGQPRARRRDRPGDRGQLLRGGRRPGLQPGGHRHPPGQGRPGDPGRPARPDRGHARLRHRQPGLQARRRRAAGREPRRPGPRPRPPPGRDPAPARRSRS